jgi:hypothetical protein
MRDPIYLRVLGYNYEGDFRLICIETNIAVEAETLHEAKSKMRDAVLSYFQTFSEEEIEAGAYLRKAPLRYSTLWYVARCTMGLRWISVFFRSLVTYDPRSNQLKLA